MRKTQFFSQQDLKVSDAKRLRELEYENDLLKLLYVDLLQKSVVLKERIGKYSHAS